MSLLDDVLAANSAVVDHSDVPVPAVPDGRRVVVVTCSEIRAPGGRDLAASLGFAHDEAFVVANAGGRIHAPDGDVARSVALALAQAGGGEVFVVAHENCRFLAADADTVAARIASPTSSLLQAVERLCGQTYISAGKAAMAAAQMLRTCPFLPRGTPVHAIVFNEGRGRLAVEESGYDRVGAVSSFATPGAGSMLGASPSPMLGAPGPSSFGGVGPVTLFGSGPSPLMGAGSPTLGAPAPLVAPPPDLVAAGASSFLTPPGPPTAPGFTPPPAFAPAAPSPTPSAPSAPSAPAVRWPPPPPPPPVSPPPPSPSFEPFTFQSPPPLPPPPPSRPEAKPAPRKPSSDVDDPFRKAAETLERLRRERRR